MFLDVEQEDCMGRELSTIPNGMTLRDAIALLDAQHHDTPGVFETSRAPGSAALCGAAHDARRGRRVRTPESHAGPGVPVPVSDIAAATTASMDGRNDAPRQDVEEPSETAGLRS